MKSKQFLIVAPLVAALITACNNGYSINDSTSANKSAETVAPASQSRFWGGVNSVNSVKVLNRVSLDSSSIDQINESRSKLLKVGTNGLGVQATNMIGKLGAPVIVGITETPYVIPNGEMALNSDAAVITQGSPSGGITLTKQATSKDEQDLFGVDAGASLSGYGASVKTSVSYLREHQSNKKSIDLSFSARQLSNVSVSFLNSIPNFGTWMRVPFQRVCASYNVNIKKKACSVNIGMKTPFNITTAEELLDTYGTNYVSTQQVGLVYNLDFHLDFSNESEMEQVKASINAAYDSPSASASMFVKIQQALATHNVGTNLSVSSYQWGGEPLKGATVFKDLAKCDLGSPEGAQHCDNIISNAVDYVTEDLSQQVKNTTNLYVFPAATEYSAYSNLKNTTLTLKDDNAKTYAADDLGIFWQGAYDVDGRKAEFQDYMKYLNGLEEKNSIINSYNNQTAALWGGSSELTLNQNNWNRFMNIVNQDGSVRLMEKTFIHAPSKVAFYPSSYLYVTGTKTPLIQYEKQQATDHQEKNYPVNSSLVSYIESNSYILGDSGQASKLLSRFLLLPTDTLNRNPKNYILASATKYLPDGTSVNGDLFEDTKFYIRDAGLVNNRQAYEIFGDFKYLQDNSMNYQPYGDGANGTKKVNWVNNSCNYPRIHIVPGTRIQLGYQTTNRDTATYKDSKLVWQDSSLGDYCYLSKNSPKINCNGRGIFAFYTANIDSGTLEKSDACMRTLVKIQELFKVLNKSTTSDFNF